MTEVTGTDRDKPREDVLRETPLVPESVDDVRTSDYPVNRGGKGLDGAGAEPAASNADLGTD